MAERMDRKKDTRARGGKRVLEGGLGALGAAPELQNLQEVDTPATAVSGHVEAVQEALAQEAARIEAPIASETPEPPEESPESVESAEPVQSEAVVEAATEATEETPDDEVTQLGKALESAKPRGEGVVFNHSWWDPKDGTRIFKDRATGEFFRMYHNDWHMFTNKEGEDRPRRWDTNENVLSTKPDRTAVADPVEAAVVEAKDKDVEEGKRALTERINGMAATLTPEQIENFHKSVEAANTPGAIRAMNKSLDGWMPKKMTTRERAVASETEIDVDRARAAMEKEIRREVNAKKKELRDRLTILRDTNKISQAFYDVTRAEMQRAKYVQELKIFEDDLTRIENEELPLPPAEAAAPASTEAAPAAAEAAPAPAPQSAEALAREILAEPSIPPATAATPEARPAPRESVPRVRPPVDVHRALQEDARRERHDRIQEAMRGEAHTDNHQELLDRINNMPAASGGGSNQPPTDALRQPGSAGAEAAHEEGAPESAFDRRNYVGLPIMTVQEILADTTHAQFFGELVHAMRDDSGAIQQRYFNGTATKDDMSFMNYARHEYSKWNFHWEELSHHITDIDVDMFVRRNQSLENIVGHVGRERGASVLKNMLRYTAMRDPATFESIEHAVHEAQGLRESFIGRVANGKIESIAARVGIPREEFETVFDFTSPESEEKTRDHVLQLIRARAGRGRRTMDWLSRISPTPLGGSSEIAADRILEDAKAAIKGRFGLTGKKLRNLDHTLSHASDGLDKVVGSDEVIEQISREALSNEARRPGMEAGPESFAQTREAIEKIKTADIEQKITERIRTEGPRWESGGRAYQDSVLSDMKREEKKKHKIGTGFWAWLLGADFASKFNKAASKATERPAHVH